MPETVTGCRAIFEQVPKGTLPTKHVVRAGSGKYSKRKHIIHCVQCKVRKGHDSIAIRIIRAFQLLAIEVFMLIRLQPKRPRCGDGGRFPGSLEAHRYAVAAFWVLP